MRKLQLFNWGPAVKTKRRPVILLDMDNTLYNFDAKIKEPGTRNPSEMWSPGFFESLEPTKGALKAVAELNKIADVYICTKPLAMSPISYLEKVNSIMRWFPVLGSKIIMCQKKSMIRGEILIDDEKDNCLTFFGKSILFDINKDTEEQWEEIVQLIKEEYDR